MIVELVGPAGSGKSTYGPLIAERIGAGTTYVNLDARGPFTRIGIWMQRIGGGAFNPRLLLHCSQVLPRTRLGRRWAAKVASMNLLVRLMRRDGGPYVIEEGPIHTLLWAAAFHQRRSPSRAAHAMSLPDLIAYFEVAPEEAARRVMGRTTSLVAGMTFEEVCDFTVEYDRLARNLLASLPCRVVVLSSVSPEEASDLIKNSLC